MSKAKILAIAPYPGLKSLMEEQARKRTDLEVTVFVGDLEEGAEVAKRYQQEFDVIISRGGTAHKIERVCRIPAVDIPVTGGDVLAAVCLAREYSGSCAVIAFPNITNSISLICDLAGFQADVYTIGSTREAAACLENIQSKKYSIIVGDNIVYSLAKQQGLNTILITSGVDSINLAFQEAVMIHRATAQERRSRKLMGCLLSQWESYIRAYEADGRLVTSTEPTGWEPLAPAVTQALETHARDVLCQGAQAFTVSRDSFDYHVRAQAVSYARDCEPVAAFFIGKPTYIPPWIIGMDSLGEFDYPFKLNRLDSKPLNSFLERLAQCARGPEGTLITGCRGSKLDAAAYLVHRNGPNGNRPMLLVDSARLNAQKLEWLFEDEKSPLREPSRTVYFSSLHLLGQDLLDGLAGRLKASPFLERDKLLFSCAQTDMILSDSPPNPVKRVCQALPCSRLVLPGIREYAEDIPHIVHMLINDLNIRLGTLVTGLQPRAMRLLQEYAWDGDMEQLVSVMTQLVQEADSNLISLDRVREVLQSRTAVKQPGPSRINLNQPLDDIMVEIIKAVLEEEGGNQSKAAKRLGISRATLWRRLRPGPRED